MGRKGKIRLKKWRRQSGLCFYCKRKTVLPEKLRHKENKHPLNLATLDHLFPRAHPLANRSNNCSELNKTVMACRECNQERGEQQWDVFFRLKELHVARRAKKAHKSEKKQIAKAARAKLKKERNKAKMKRLIDMVGGEEC